MFNTMQPAGALSSPQAPAVVPALAKKPASVWDKENRQRTFLAMAQAFGSNKNFFGGLGDAAGNVGSLMDNLAAKKKKFETPDLVGPNSSFERRIDPDTGAITYEPVKVMQDFLQSSKVDQGEDNEVVASALRVLENYPEADRPATWDDMARRPDVYGLPKGAIKGPYEPSVARIRAGMGQTVTQARTSDNRDRALDTRTDQSERRLGIYGQRAADLTRQGDARIGQGQQRLNKAPPSTRKGGGGGKSSAPSGGYRKIGGVLMQRKKK